MDPLGLPRPAAVALVSISLGRVTVVGAFVIVAVTAVPLELTVTRVCPLSSVEMATKVAAGPSPITDERPGVSVRTAEPKVICPPTRIEGASPPEDVDIGLPFISGRTVVDSTSSPFLGICSLCSGSPSTRVDGLLVDNGRFVTRDRMSCSRDSLAVCCGRIVVRDSPGVSKLVWIPTTVGVLVVTITWTLSEGAAPVLPVDGDGSNDSKSDTVLSLCTVRAPQPAKHVSTVVSAVVSCCCRRSAVGSHPGTLLSACTFAAELGTVLRLEVVTTMVTFCASGRAGICKSTAGGRRDELNFVCAPVGIARVLAASSTSARISVGSIATTEYLSPEYERSHQILRVKEVTKGT